jgi:alpha-galactosidase
VPTESHISHIHALNIEFTCEVSAAPDVPLLIESATQPVADSTDTVLLRFRVRRADEQPFVLDGLRMRWTVPVVDMHGLYFGGNPKWELTYLPFWKTEKTVAAQTGVPYLSLIHRSGANRLAVGSFDQWTETTISGELSEMTRCYHFEFSKPSHGAQNGQKLPADDVWEETLYVSRAALPWPKVLAQYVQTFDAATEPNLFPVPDSAYAPVFCSWTAIHHDVSHAWVMRNARIAADLGFGTWITDDGWFTEHGKFADYSVAGDWIPSEAKFPPFREHVEAVQALGLRYILWVAPFMVGYESEAAQRYAHLLTDGREPIRFWNLSPWHDETQTIVTSLLRGMVQDYGVDGLKIDFIDSVPPHSRRIEGASDAPLGQRIAAILDGVMRELVKDKPDILIEFRNTYSNLASRSYANIYRCSDVPINPTLNRWQATLLRLLTPDRAVHLDPALWHPEDTDENVAAHLINLLVGVPMVSIELEEYPASHLALIRHWVGFYNSHRQTLAHGSFRPTLGVGSIPVVRFDGVDETIIAVYENVPVALEDTPHTVWLLNAATSPTLDVRDIELRGERSVTVHDKFGQVVSQQRVTFPLVRLDVEVGGSVQISA